MPEDRFLHSINGSIRREMILDEREHAARPNAPIVAVSEQEVEDILRHTATIRDEATGDTFRHVGSMPGVVYERALREGWAHDPKKIEEWFRENPAFATGKF